ncbi:vgr related protein [Microbulbifer sp. GL-2]|uniref:vgr related protein n=1 Tax=Microbulbifer sp. GL-2 TaxID=2591606 RepID=UPI001163AD0F|nr:vgr related protein [Microbulbifer sp. GL-2]BBM03562.1 hypothetical protein GL2_36360 [Microbulbifer sp. GL-2]
MHGQSGEALGIPSATATSTDSYQPTMKVGESRFLTEGEKELASSIFGEVISDYDSVKVIRDKYIFFQTKNVVMAPDGNIYFHPKSAAYRDDFSVDGNIDLQGLFIHEMTHVYQHQLGIDVRKAALNRNYKYELPIVLPSKGGRPFSKYSLERQGDIVRDYFWLKNNSRPKSMLNNPDAPSLKTYEELIPF